MIHHIKTIIKGLVASMLFLVCAQQVYSQAQVQPWGNITAINVDGQPLCFESSLRVVTKNWTHIKATAKERQKPKYQRNGALQTITTAIDSIRFTEVVEDAGKGTAKVTVQVEATADRNTEGVFFALCLPEEYNAKSSMQLNNGKPVPLPTVSDKANTTTPAIVNAVRFTSPLRQLNIVFSEPTAVILKKETHNGLTQTQVYLPVQSGPVAKGQTFSKAYTITASGAIDKKPVVLAINTTAAGRAFDGLGGNFRLQNAKTDPQVIDYCLQNLRVAWGRVEMPWRFWQPQQESNPIDSAKAGKLHNNVQKAMEMAQQLHKLGMPVVLTAWSAPDWAIVGAAKLSPDSSGVWGNPLDHAKDTAIYKSIADYILFLKEQYGVEVSLFSFNESDLGINIRQTGEEHAALIKGLGSYFVSHGLKTKMLLGDNSDATTYTFIDPAIADAATHPFIGAVSFHSWRGWEKETLEKWAAAATKLQLPLLVGEGSIDAAAWNYPDIFEEPVYAMEEINLYVRLLAICQPASILQWQLTADYSPLAGGGIFGNTDSLHPTQRFWNLKQLSGTPQGLKAMPLSSNVKDVSAAALGDNNKSIYALHLVNNGASRAVTLVGLPATARNFRLYVTDAKRNMQEGKNIPVTNGKASFQLEAATYTTLISN